jgi:two-component system, cell cycle sensor histidine kinase and response regulator CckA
VNVRRRTRTGEWLDIESNSVALRDACGEVAGYVSVSRDVTARKRAEAALRASQERLARVLEASAEGIWVVDARGRTEFANARAAEMVGVPEREIVGRFFFDLMPAELRGRARAALRLALRGERVAGEFPLRRPDGSEIWVQLSGRALRDAEGQVEGAVSVFMDVTARRATREQLLQAQKMEAVGQLASGVAHDFNNLLAVVLSNARSLAAELPPGELREDAQAIRQAGERAADLVRQLLAFSHRNSGRPVAIDPGAVVRGIEALLRRAVGEGVALSLSLAGDGWQARIDPGQLEQVLVNLAVNARDAMADKGELRIETGSLEIRSPPPACPTLRPGRYAVISVTDTGCGMTPEVLSRIFEPFFTTKPTGKGTGLGLSTVHGLVEGAGGRIAVESEPGRGATFTVYLPACGPEVPEPDRARGSPPAGARPSGNRSAGRTTAA